MSRELDLLTHGSVEIVGRVADSSNATFAVVVTGQPDATTGETDEWFAIYKPELGERPLWDFEPGLHRRELAAYRLSEHLGWALVPPTVIRGDLQVGEGSLQWFIESDEADHYFTLVDRDATTHDTFRQLALFDYVVNNTDRKSGHVLRDADGHIWGIDHGLCFAAEYKLRTVIWEFAGEPVDPDLLEAIAPLADDVPAEVGELINGRERKALRRRVQRILDHPFLPHDASGGYGYPWPLV